MNVPELFALRSIFSQLFVPECKQKIPQQSWMFFPSRFLSSPPNYLLLIDTTQLAQ